ncbi:hypothetical protein R3P38DRAFT_2838442 [Favolaschia claudopus]|uniref:Fungal N-terminal domain-containing protein n=1 Tax=Favolaschia claudopus TaxID=2862362 RepID=A0AAW0E6M9_9AGAR
MAGNETLHPRSGKRIRQFIKGTFGRLKPSAKNTGASAQDVLSTGLTALRSPADAFPPLKGVVGAVVAILEISERITHSKTDAHELARIAVRIQHVLACATPDADMIHDETQQNITRLKGVLQEIEAEINSLTDRSRIYMLTHLNRNEESIQTSKRRLDEALQEFSIGALTRIEVALFRIEARLPPLSNTNHTFVREVYVLRGLIIVTVIPYLFYISPVWRPRGTRKASKYITPCVPLHLQK